jgi:hypothetical protein
MQHKILSTPTLTSDIIDVISSHISYVNGLAAFRQTSKQMDEAVENAFVGQLANQLRRNPLHHGKNYEKLFAVPISFLPTAIVAAPCGIGVIIGLVGYCMSPLGGVAASSTAQQSLRLSYSSYRLFTHHAHKNTQKFLLSQIKIEREDIEKNHEEIRTILSKPISVERFKF